MEAKMNAGKTERFCRKCLVMTGQEEYFRDLNEYIENLSPDIKADNGLYESRLVLCQECELLLEGMCRTCGCFVILRAAVKNGSCPRSKW